MADYRYLVKTTIHWNQNKYFQEIMSFLQNCAKDLRTSITRSDTGDLLKEAYKLIAPLEIFGYCPYYVESMKQNYVWPYDTESAAEAYSYRVLVFAAAYFIWKPWFWFDEFRPYYKTFIGQQGGIANKFKDWEKEAKQKDLRLNGSEVEKKLKDIGWLNFHRNPWDKITGKFEPEVMVRILDRYKKVEDKKKLLDFMEAFCLIRSQFAYMLDAERPGSIAKFREWIGKDMEINPHHVKERYATYYEKDYMVVQHVDNEGDLGHIGGRSNLPYKFFSTMFYAIGHWRCDADKPMGDYTDLSWNCFILREIVFLWNKFNKTEVLPNSEDGFEYVGNEYIDVDTWLSFYALLFVKSDRKDWEDQLMQKNEDGAASNQRLERPSVRYA